MLTALPVHRRPLFACAVYTAMRRGELFALQKIDVDLDDDTIRIMRSNDADTTKGKKKKKRPVLIPIADELRPYMVAAINASPSKLVFPRGDGTMQSRNSGLLRLLQRALGRAGILTGYLHKCRGRGCGF